MCFPGCAGSHGCPFLSVHYKSPKQNQSQHACAEVGNALRRIYMGTPPLTTPNSKTFFWRKNNCYLVYLHWQHFIKFMMGFIPVGAVMLPSGAACITCVYIMSRYIMSEAQHMLCKESFSFRVYGPVGKLSCSNLSP